MEDALPDRRACTDCDHRGIADAAAELDAIEAEIDAEVDEPTSLRRKRRGPIPPPRPEYVFAEPALARRLTPPAHRRPRRAKSATCRRHSKPWPKRWPATRSIFVLGEGIGKRGGNFKTTAGLYDAVRPRTAVRHADLRARLRRTRLRRRHDRHRPVIDFMFADFVLDAVGEIINQIAKMQYMSSGRLQMPILLRGCIGIGHSAATHHSGNYYPMYAQFPGLRVVVPSTPMTPRDC